MTAAAPPRSLSYLTGEYSIQLDYAGLTSLMDEVFALWDSLKLDATDEKIGEAFGALVEHVAYLRSFTGWEVSQGEVSKSIPNGNFAEWNISDAQRADASHATDFTPPIYNVWKQQEKTE